MCSHGPAVRCKNGGCQHRMKFNLQANLNLGTVIKTPTPDVRVLGVWLDTKLRWTVHVYTAIVRPTISYGASVWRNPKGEGQES